MATSGQERQVARALTSLAKKNPVMAVVVAVALVAVIVYGGIAAGTSASGSASSQGSSATAASDGLAQATVVHVVDGDTLKVRLANGTENYVRLIGIDAPESVAPQEERNCEEGRLASDHMKTLVKEGQSVWLQTDVSDTDTHGRWLRYVWLEQPSDQWSETEIEQKMLNAVLVSDGYAEARHYKPDTANDGVLGRLGEEALADGRGVSYKWA